MAMFNSERDKGMAAVIAVMLLLAFAYHTYVHSPRAAELEQTQARLDSLVQMNERAKAELARGNVDELRSQARAYQENLEVMRQLVPVSNEVPALLEQVSTAARRVGLDVASVEPQPVIVGNEFDTHRYTMSVVGGYHDVAKFLTNVGSLTRIIAPVKLELVQLANQQAVAARAKRGESVLDAQFDIQTYVARSGAGTAAGSLPGDQP
ncbi:MAG: type 4a pilus biogenesis protein PilO [Gemmatimonadaceae bacterium]